VVVPQSSSIQFSFYTYQTLLSLWIAMADNSPKQPTSAETSNKATAQEDGSQNVSTKSLSVVKLQTPTRTFASSKNTGVSPDITPFHSFSNDLTQEIEKLGESNPFTSICNKVPSEQVIHSASADNLLELDKHSNSTDIANIANLAFDTPIPQTRIHSRVTSGSLSAHSLDNIILANTASDSYIKSPSINKLTTDFKIIDKVKINKSVNSPDDSETTKHVNSPDHYEIAKHVNSPANHSRNTTEHANKCSNQSETPKVKKVCFSFQDAMQVDGSTPQASSSNWELTDRENELIHKDNPIWEYNVVGEAYESWRVALNASRNEAKLQIRVHYLKL
jgi:hypothetical protein